ncbi:unnamed protein product [Ixodes persulcatus]
MFCAVYHLTFALFRLNRGINSTLQFSGIRRRNGEWISFSGLRYPRFKFFLRRDISILKYTRTIFHRVKPLPYNGRSGCLGCSDYITVYQILPSMCLPNFST